MTNALQVGERVACAWGLGLICLMHTILRGNLFHVRGVWGLICLVHTILRGTLFH